MTRKVTSYRLPEMTLAQIKALTESTGSSDANVIAFAIDRMYQQEIKTMTTVTIEQKMSGTGTIHDLASQHFDRHIEFGDDDKYAIVLAAYYGNGDNYYLAKSKEEAIAIHEAQAEFSHAIIDRDGDPISIDWLYYS